MGITAIIIIAILVFVWSWRRLYRYNMRKRPNPTVAHLLGILLGSFPGLFFFYAGVATLTPTTVSPAPPLGALIGLWAIFVLSVGMLLYLTTRPLPSEPGRAEGAQEKPAEPEPDTPDRHDRA